MDFGIVCDGFTYAAYMNPDIDIMKLYNAYEAYLASVGVIDTDENFYLTIQCGQAIRNAPDDQKEIIIKGLKYKPDISPCLQK